MPENTKSITVSISDTAYRQLAAAAEREGTTLEALAAAALEAAAACVARDTSA